MPTFQKSIRIQASARRVYQWHLNPDALEKLIPPWEKVRVLEAPMEMRDGARAVLAVRAGPFQVKWIAEHRGVVDRGENGGEFVDVQVAGPFRAWTHRHTVSADGAAACVLKDHIEYELPFGRIGECVGGWFVRRKLERMFEFRHAVTKQLNELPVMMSRESGSGMNGAAT